MNGQAIIIQFSRETGIPERTVSTAAARIYPALFRPRVQPHFTPRLANQLNSELHRYFQQEVIHA